MTQQGQAIQSYGRIQNTATRNPPRPDREAIVNEFLPSIRIPPHIEIDDLVSCGVVGLLDALERFDGNRGIKFRTFAEFRIRGAMLDHLREMDWFPRTARRDSNRLQRVCVDLEQSLGRPPEEDEVAKKLEIGVEDLRKRLAAFAGMTVFSLDAIEEDDDGNAAGWRHAITEAALDETREEELTRELRDVLGKAIDQLPERERKLIAFYYFEDLTLREISRIFGLGEPRVCQIHAQAVLRLKGKIGKQVR
jgi:RNA polymerase sigma factor for flagellar operon FliA